MLPVTTSTETENTIRDPGTSLGREVGSSSWKHRQPALWVTPCLCFSLTGVQVPEVELPPSAPVPEVTTPEPGVYHGICEYPVLGSARGRRAFGVGRPGLWHRVCSDVALWPAG